ncbi:hypothetical protein [Gramella sp. MAR_2010_147]|uniref:hypothetical protein n=1 Tax=Gramella sp. MAR_2010_147 TaxID=1250205 RepID=UPI00087CA738|nr:hypothetical protein [Gramella sp. MAR_2010_147]SDS28857.1 hypothetical protein SAMN04488553_1912 [Gramella sp. MAR_2010_147]
MNLIKELTVKHNLPYKEKRNLTIKSPLGLYHYEPQTGSFEINGSKITLNFNPVNGISRVTEPASIRLHFEDDLQTYLEISPKSKFQKMIDSILIQKSRKIQQEFEINGDVHLIENLISHRKLSDLLKGERVFLKIDKNDTSSISLVSQYGITNVNQFEKYLGILKIIKQKLFQLQLTAV